MDYSKQSRFQIARFDASNCFVEVMADALAIDKVKINFVSYNKEAEAGSRSTGSVTFYLPVLKARVLAEMVLNGRLYRRCGAAVAKAKEEGKKYPAPVWQELGGTTASKAKRADGKAISRTLSIAPGSKFPYVLTGESGPGVAGPNGLLIVPDYGYGKEVSRPEQVVRVPLSEDAMEEFAMALKTAADVWAQARFTPLLAEQMAEKNNAFTAKFNANRAATPAPAPAPAPTPAPAPQSAYGQPYMAGTSAFCYDDEEEF